MPLRSILAGEDSVLDPKLLPLLTPFPFQCRTSGPLLTNQSTFSSLAFSQVRANLPKKKRSPSRLSPIASHDVPAHTQAQFTIAPTYTDRNCTEKRPMSALARRKCSQRRHSRVVPYKFPKNFLMPINRINCKDEREA